MEIVRKPVTMPPHETLLTNFFRNGISNCFCVLVSRAPVRAEARGGRSACAQQRDSGRRSHWRIATRSDGHTRRPSHWLDYAERSEEHTSELQSLAYLVCRLLLEKKNTTYILI